MDTIGVHLQFHAEHIFCMVSYSVSVAIVTDTEVQAKETTVNTYPSEELVKLWARGDLTAEQSIGHLMQHIVILYERLVSLERRFASLSANSETQQGTGKTQSSSRIKKKSSSK
jgi:hypothetical protein